jgi:hypothetical protein
MLFAVYTGPSLRLSNELFSIVEHRVVVDVLPAADDEEDFTPRPLTGTLLLHGCHTIITLLLYCFYTV